MLDNFTNIRLLKHTTSVFLLCFALLIVQARAQVIVDSRSAGGAFSNTGVTTLSWTHTVGSGSNRALFVGVSLTNQASSTPVNNVPTVPLLGTFAASQIVSVTDNGVAMQRVTGGINSVTESAVYQLASPPTGANNIVVMITPLAVTNASGNSVSFTGVNQATPAVNPANATGNSTMPAVTVSGTGVTTNDIVFDALASTPNAGFFVEGAGQTVCGDPSDETTCTRGRRFFFFAYDVGASSTKAGNPLGVTTSWTMTTAQPWSLSATVVKAAPALPTAASVTVSGRVTNSSGRAVARARVTMTDSNGETRYALTNTFGYYRFSKVAAGETYVFSASAKRYEFAPRVLTVNEETSELNFTGAN